MTWPWIGRLLRGVFLLRVPLLTLLILGALGPLARTIAGNLLGNVLDQDGNPWNFSLVAFIAFLLSATAITTINLVLENGCDRIDDPALRLSQQHPLLTYILGMLPAVLLVYCVSLQTGKPWWWDVAFSLLGFVTAMSLVFLAKGIQMWLTDPDVTPYPPPYLVFPVYRIPKLDRTFDRLYCRKPKAAGAIKDAIFSLAQWPLEILRPAGQGYFIGDTLRLRSGHVFGLALAIISFATYLLIGWAKQIGIGKEAARVPALAYVLLFCIVACWSLAGLAFFFDRYRFPLLWTIAALSLLTTFVPESDHFYRVVHLARPLPAFPKPSDVLDSRIQPGKTRVVLIATAGGGIQAAGWTAQVLQGMTKMSQQAGSDFPGSVVLISAVSGGSLGSLSFVRSYPGAVADKPLPFDSSAARAEEAALDEVAWGWINPDFWRTIIPWFRSRVVDRAWALEKKWAAIQELNDTQAGEHDTLLSRWAQLSTTSVPAVVFNTMIVEAGQPLVFSNTDFPRNNPRIWNFYEVEGRSVDVRVNTAVRMSASFSYVAPAARSDTDSPAAPDFHLVDGGYYDNFGINSLLGWLEDALASSSQADSIGDILILQIRSFQPNPPANKAQHGWGFQLIAPLVGLFNMRDAAQDANDATALQFFARDYDQRRAGKGRIWTARFTYPFLFTDRQCGNPPLSWKLSAAQKTCIADAWDAQKFDSLAKAEGCVLSYLKGGDLKQCEDPAN